MRVALAIAALTLLVAALSAAPWFVSDYGLAFLINLMCYVVLTVAWALFSGTTRYVSLATSAFFGVGTYAVAMLIKVMPIYAIFAVALVLGGVLSLLVGMVTLRISGMFFVIFGFGLSEMIRELMVWWEINKTSHHGLLRLCVVRQYLDPRAPARARRAGLPGGLCGAPFAAGSRAARHRR